MNEKIKDRVGRYSMYEVELVDHSNGLLDLYIELFEKKYKTKPMLDSAGRDGMICKDIVRQRGIAKAKELMQQYFRSSDPWFQKNANAMILFKNNLNVLNVELSRRSPVVENQVVSKGIMIQIKGYCINKKCPNRFDVICNSNDVEKKTWSEHCGLCSFGEEQYA